MTRATQAYCALLLAAVAGWLALNTPLIQSLGSSQHWPVLVGIIALYLCSHVFRMLRLALLTLDERSKLFPLIAAHALTAFPNSVLPFKSGEILRLASFFHVYDGRRKALAVWVAERLGDIIVITALIFGLYLFNVEVPASMQVILAVFVTVGGITLLGLFSMAKIFVYLNRHLVLTSVSARGLFLLRTSHQLRTIEREIARSVEGRVSGLIVLSVLIWTVEVAALSLFIHHLNIGGVQFASLFASGLLASLPGGPQGSANYFGLYQALGLAFLTLFCVAVGAALARPRRRSL